MRAYLFIFLSLYSALSFSNELVPANDYDPLIFLWLVFFIFLSRSLSIVKKIGLPLVVGEILAGVILGDLHIFGIELFKNTGDDIIIKFLAEFGAIILMFEIGLESQLSELRRNLRTGTKVALSGTILTFLGGYLVSDLLISDSSIQLNMLIGIICAATATGISAKTFKEMRILHTSEVKIVMVSSILDEIISIACFAVISAIIIDNTIDFANVATSILQVLGFFVFAALFSHWITPRLTTWSTKIHAGINMKIGVLLIICFLFAWISHAMGLATVIGAFIAGLTLDELFFTSFTKSRFFQQIRSLAGQVQDPHISKKLVDAVVVQEKRTLEELLKPLSHVFVPIFFIYIGMMLDVQKLFQTETLLLTGALLAISFTGRIISGYLVQNKNLNRLIVGLGMTPIGEAGLIFAMFGKSLGLISTTVLSSIVATLVISAVITPILIKLAIKFNGISHE